MGPAGSRILQGPSSTLRTMAATAGRETGVPPGANRRYRRPVRYWILGPVEVSGGNGPATLGGPKQRTVLAHLILSLSRVVSADQLIEAVWGETPPEAARGILQTYVSRLRSILGPDTIESRPPGYVLHADPEDVDAVRFERLLREARRGAVDPKDAVRTLSEALDLWRGPALADLADEAIALGRDRAPRGAASPGHGGTDRRRARARTPGPVHRRARVAHADAPAARAAVGGVDARPLPRRPSRRRARGVRAGAQHPRRRARDRPLARSPGAARADPPARTPSSNCRASRSAATGSSSRSARAPSAWSTARLQPQIGREVAIKAIRPELANHPDFVRRFEREAQIVARLEHPHIVPLYDYWREPDAAYLVMRFLRGGSLEDLLRRGPLEPDDAATILDQVASALAAAHRQGVVHRDVKPGNVLLDEEGNAYLTDFGVALDAGSPERTLGDDDRAARPRTCRPSRSASSRPRPGRTSTRSGSSLYEMLTGDHPFPDGSLTALLDRHLHDPLPSVRDTRPDLPRGVDEVIARATAKERGRRFTDPLELAAAFRAAVEGSATRAADRSQIRNPYKGLRAFLEADAAGLLRARGADEPARSGGSRRTTDGARFLAVVGPVGLGQVLGRPCRARARAPARRAPRLRALVRRRRPARPPPAPRARVRAARRRRRAAARRCMDELERDELGLVRAVAPRAARSRRGAGDRARPARGGLHARRGRGRTCARAREPASGGRASPAAGSGSSTTLRADFFDEPLSVRGFGDLLAARTEAIAPMSPEELERAIVAPADRAGLVVEPSLLAAIIARRRRPPERAPAAPVRADRARRAPRRRGARARRLPADRRRVGRPRAPCRAALRGPGRAPRRRLPSAVPAARDAGRGGEDTRRRVRRSELASARRSRGRWTA